MKSLLNLLLLLALTSCTTIETTQPPAIILNTKAVPTVTIPAPTALPFIAAPTEVPCDPFHVDYCSTDGHFLLERPIRPPANDLIDPSYRYGSTANGTREPHHGVEFPNPSGTPVYAVAAGIVIFAGPDEEAVYSPWQNFYGNLVVLQHDDELFTLYAHLSTIDVTSRQKIYAGDKIGEVGRTGVAIGSHLHFEVRQGNGKDYFATQNPELWLVPAKDAKGSRFGTLMISVVDRTGEWIKYADFTLQYFQKKAEPPVKSYYGTTYAADLVNGEENAMFGELPPGPYRIAVEMNGQIYERWVEVKSGKLTQVVFVVT